MPSTMLSEFLLAARSGDYLILDTETTGLHEAEIVQIAIINQDRSILLDTLVKPTVAIPIEATGVHGIDDARVAEYPPWGLVWAEVAGILAGRRVIAYNAAFDCQMLRSSTEASGLGVFDWLSHAGWFCAMRAFAEVYGSRDHYRKSFRWQTLSNACAHFGREDPQLHTALSDCRDTLFVVKSMAGLNLS